MRRILLLCLLALMALPVGAAKRALVITVGDYPEESGWTSIASGNDRDLAVRMLGRLGFPASCITVLSDSRATFAGIVKGLDALASSVRPGDEVYVHFSGHGQQMTDLDGDEELYEPRDFLDEAFIPYDAFVSYGWKGYRGERHLTDDILYRHLGRIAATVGRKGSVLLVVDACHSGGIERGSEGEKWPYRGNFNVFEMPLVARTTVPVAVTVNWVTLSACKYFQTNFEVEVGDRRYGRLTYALSRCFRPGMTPEQLATALQEEYKALPLPPRQGQTPVVNIPSGYNRKPLFRI